MNGDVAGDDIFVYMGGQQEVPRDVKRAKIIDESIDTIPSYAFLSCQQLIEVVGHNKLKKIERQAFDSCPSLTRLTNMNGVIEIKQHAFYGCTALSDLEFDKAEIIGRSAFGSCKSLRSINLPSVRRVGARAFQGCERLTDAVFGEGIEMIESDAFNRGAFHGCTALIRIAIPLKDGLVIENYAFNQCHNLSRVDVVGGIQRTISSLHLESWRDEVKREINQINQALPWMVEKTIAIREWIRSSINRMDHYKDEHQILLKEATTLLELALWKANLDENAVAQEGVRVTRRQVKRARKERCITSGAGIIIKNVLVLPFLELDE